MWKAVVKEQSTFYGIRSMLLAGSCGVSMGQGWPSSRGLQYIPLQSLHLEIKAVLAGPCGPSAPLLVLVLLVLLLVVVVVGGVMVVVGVVLLVFATCTQVHYPSSLPALQALGSGILPRSSNLTWTVSGQIAAINVDDTGPDGSALVEP